MEIKKAIDILESHNKWRRDDTGQYTMAHPKDLGMAIDTIVNEYEKSDKTSLYAGAVCPKCKKGINNEEPIDGYDEIRKRQQKRYGMARLCNQCIKGYIKDENH